MHYYFIHQIARAHIFEPGDKILVKDNTYEVKLKGSEFILVNLRNSSDILAKEITLQALALEIKKLFI